ncbi:MAG: ABC transporter ATP-binding protein [Nitrospiraceae bacterium]
MHQDPQYTLTHVLRDMVAHLAQLIRLERGMLVIIGSYAVGIGSLFLCVPIAVQELVSTFSFSMEARMVFTLAGAVFVALLGVAYLRERQARAVETLQQRVYTRIAVAFTEVLPALADERSAGRHAHRFVEADLMTRALVMMVADLFNVAVAGSVAAFMLMFASPAFLAFLAVLFLGYWGMLTFFGRGGFLITLKMSQFNYQLVDWIRNVADNAVHLRAVESREHLVARTDALLHPYIRVRQQRSDTLTGRQYKATAFWLAFGHAAMIATAGMLVVDRQITVGQFAGAEILVGNLLMHMDTLARRMVAVFFLFTSMRELAGVFAQPRVPTSGEQVTPLHEERSGGLRVTCHHAVVEDDAGARPIDDFTCDIAPGEKVVVLTPNGASKAAMVRLLAGLTRPTSGLIRYNDVNLVEVSPRSMNRHRGLMLDSHPTLIHGTVQENIALGRDGVGYAEVSWALQFVELEGEIDRLPLGIQTRTDAPDVALSRSQILRILLARAIVTRPPLLIFDGTLHSLWPGTRDVLLRRLCAKDEPWTVLFVSNDPSVRTFVDRQITLAPTSERR